MIENNFHYSKEIIPNRITTEKVITLFRNLFSEVYIKDNHDLQNFNSNGDQTALDRVQPAIDRFDSDVCSLVVIGEIKKGKSSLINALLDLQNVLPVQDNVATSTVFKIVYGEARKNIVVLRKDTSAELLPDSFTKEDFKRRRDKAVSSFETSMAESVQLVEKEISEDELSIYGTEDGNPNNERGVDHIRVEGVQGVRQLDLQYVLLKTTVTKIKLADPLKF